MGYWGCTLLAHSVCSMQFEKAAINEPSRSLNELIRLSSVQPQSEKIDAIIRHREMLQSPKLACTQSAAAAAVPETRAALTVPYISLLIRLPIPSVRLSFHPPVLSNMDDTTSSSGYEKSIPCQLRGRAGVSCDRRERNTIAQCRRCQNRRTMQCCHCHARTTAANCCTAETGRFSIKFITVPANFSWRRLRDYLVAVFCLRGNGVALCQRNYFTSSRVSTETGDRSLIYLILNQPLDGEAQRIMATATLTTREETV